MRRGWGWRLSAGLFAVGRPLTRVIPGRGFGWVPEHAAASCLAGPGAGKMAFTLQQSRTVAGTVVESRVGDLLLGTWISVASVGGRSRFMVGPWTGEGELTAQWGGAASRDRGSCAGLPAVSGPAFSRWPSWVWDLKGVSRHPAWILKLP